MPEPDIPDAMDDIARYNRERWEALAAAGIAYTVPMLDMSEADARRFVDREGLIGDARGLDVLCLACGGGQQSAAFGLLGANVVVVDLSKSQLAGDRLAARRYGHDIRTIAGDMRDLSAFESGSFDVVCHAYSLNFVPDARQVFRQVARTLRRGGIYQLSCVNPYFHALEASDWNGDGYPMREPYADGEITGDDEWSFRDGAGNRRRARGPREFRHTFSTLLNGMAEAGFALLKMREAADWNAVREEEGGGDAPRPGSWAHFTSVAPPYLDFWMRKG